MLSLGGVSLAQSAWSNHHVQIAGVAGSTITTNSP